VLRFGSQCRGGSGLRRQPPPSPAGAVGYGYFIHSQKEKERDKEIGFFRIFLFSNRVRCIAHARFVRKESMSESVHESGHEFKPAFRGIIQRKLKSYLN
jgi:hypothetical protein